MLGHGNREFAMLFFISAGGVEARCVASGGALRGKWRRAAWQVEVRCVTKCKGLYVVLLLYRAFSLHKFRGFDGGWGILPLRPFEAVKGA